LSLIVAPIVFDFLFVILDILFAMVALGLLERIF